MYYSYIIGFSNAPTCYVVTYIKYDPQILAPVKVLVHIVKNDNCGVKYNSGIFAEITVH